MPMTRLVVTFVAEWGEGNECGEFDPHDVEYGEKIYPDTFTGQQKAKRFWSRKESLHGGARLERQEWDGDPDFMPDWQETGVWEVSEFWDFTQWRLPGR